MRTTAVLRALLLLAVASATLARLRRPQPAPALAALPAPHADADVDADAVTEIDEPDVEHFEVVAAGRSALLRVLPAAGQPTAGAVLVVEHGDGADVLDALPSPLTGGALGFACSREVLAGGPRFWLRLDGRAIALGSPAERALAA